MDKNWLNTTFLLKTGTISIISDSLESRMNTLENYALQNNDIQISAQSTKLVSQVVLEADLELA